MGHEFHDINELFNFHENVLPPGVHVPGAELRSISCRVPDVDFQYLGTLSEKWGMSRSALAALLISTALNQIDLREQHLKEEKARQAAL